MNKSLTVSVGIPVYNESANVKNMLTSLITQKERNFKLLEIIVISDGSTDRTISEIKEIKDSRIKVYDEKPRLGQNVRLNQFLDMFRGEIAVVFEGDLLADKSCLEELIEPFYHNKDLALSCGANRPIELKKGSFWTRVFTFIDSLKINRLQKLNKGKNIYVACSCRALGRRLAAKFRWPEDVPEDSFLFLYCQRNRQKMVFQPGAVAYFKSPGNMIDYFRKTGKYNKGKEKLKEYFSQNLVKSNFFIPKTWLFNFLITGLIKNPIYTIGYIIGWFFSKIYLGLTPEFTPFWKVSYSTKKLNY